MSYKNGKIVTRPSEIIIFIPNNVRTLNREY
jgi:hypothetical protein